MTIPLARRNLLYERGKLILSVLGIAASLTLMMLLFGFQNGLFAAASAYVESTGADLLVTQSGAQGVFAASTIPAAVHDTLASTSGAVDIEHALVNGIIFTRGNFRMPVTLAGYDPKTGVGGPWKLGAGRGVQTDDEAVLDTWLAQRAGVGLNDSVNILGKRFQVVGLARETSSFIGAYIFISRSAAEQAMQRPGSASFYMLRLPKGADVQTVAKAIETQVQGVETMTPAENVSLYWKLLGSVLNAPINMMLLIGVFTGTAVMALTAYTAIVDRMREYGVMKAVGADRNWLRRQIISETLYRAVLGFVVGVGLAYAAAQLIMALFPQFTIIIRPEVVALTGVLTLAMTLSASLLPLRRIAALDPAMVFKA